jgi:hypothetical protein
MEPVYVPKSPHEKAMQRALIQYRNPKNYELVEEALKLAHREDLIGFDKKCLIRPRGTGRPGAYGGGASGKPAGKNGGKGAGAGEKGSAGAGKTAQTKKKAIRNVHKKKGTK